MTQHVVPVVMLEHLLVAMLIAVHVKKMVLVHHVPQGVQDLLPAYIVAHFPVS
jgi:hypothetical protein